MKKMEVHFFVFNCHLMNFPLKIRRPWLMIAFLV